MINDFETGCLGTPDVIARTGAGLLALAIVKELENQGSGRSASLPGAIPAAGV